MKRILGFVLALVVVLSGCASHNELEEERVMEPNTASGAESDLTPIPSSDGNTYAEPAQPVAPAPQEETIGAKHHKSSKKAKKANHKKKNKKLSKKAKKAKKSAVPPSDEQ